ncbi:alcohol dehydrogenase catalytic domain-containing protein [Stackebrandtia nassauensis]|uniref:Alcohol dehydrogenase GroES domain protein n=1 Tax=Stackebrandtia nassauensis (strain DSM 44728 / CIP 108903 / NRRL B-16338 / NBRC 102104 / LLR-40K-21) TaxID=446470 RepID=D3Q880_STANL|nr:alcohol dehydrogenase catalytic domain-containing protein [Stackebrandtia nassauensis]ADD42454.1 Alcohol dehydrogenase GroES domain protein [Stackebrandtia nassauensis DSM 44728]
MKAVTWQAPGELSVEKVADPAILEPTDAIIRVTSTGICGSDLHLYSLLGMCLEPGEILGHEPMGIVEEVGSAVTSIQPGDRVVVPFNIACGTCWMCVRGLTSQCETTQVRQSGKGGQIFGYTSLYGAIPGGQAELLRVPQAQFGPVKVPHDESHRYLLLCDVLPTAWQGASYAEVGPGDNVVVVGLGPVGQLAARVARLFGADTVIGLDRVAERLYMAARNGIHTVDISRHDPAELVRDLTDGRGADAVIEAVGMEAHGAPAPESEQETLAALPKSVARVAVESFGGDRMAALTLAFQLVRRGGAVSILGVYGGRANPMPLMDLFDKQITLRMGQTNVRHWLKEILPEIERPDDPLGLDDLVTHEFPLTEAPRAYEWFARQQNGCVKVVLRP